MRCITTGLAGAMVFIISALSAMAAAPPLINYQALLTDSTGTPVANGNYSITFRILDAASGGAVLWTETQVSVAIAEGNLSTLLGSVTALDDAVFAGTDAYLEIQVGTEVLSPRSRLVSSGYAHRISTVDGAKAGTLEGALEVKAASNPSTAFKVTEALGGSAFQVATDAAGNAAAEMDGKMTIRAAPGGGTALTVSESGGTPALEINVDGAGVASAELAGSLTLHGEPGGSTPLKIVKASGGNSSFEVTLDATGNAVASILNPVDEKAGPGAVANRQIAFTNQGIIFFGATEADTNMCLFTNGDIASKGKIAVGASSSAGGTFATVFGYNNDASGDSATIGGGYDNTASGFVGVISGGAHNIASGDVSTIAGGVGNEASGYISVIGGGSGNKAIGQEATVGGGDFNEVHSLQGTIAGGQQNIIELGANRSTIGGGRSNTIASSTTNAGTIAGGWEHHLNAANATICGGSYDTATGVGAVVCGGDQNKASGQFSYAAGWKSKAIHSGAWVWSSGGGAVFESTDYNQFSVRAPGGFRFITAGDTTSGVTLAAGASAWAAVSDSTLKRNIRLVDGDWLLEQLDKLPISRWSYRAQDASVEHIGPMAQDLHRLFSVGDDERRITTIDPDGIALAAAQQLNRHNRELHADNDLLRQRVEELSVELRRLSEKLDRFVEARPAAATSMATLTPGD